MLPDSSLRFSPALPSSSCEMVTGKSCVPSKPSPVSSRTSRRPSSCKAMSTPSSSTHAGARKGASTRATVPFSNAPSAAACSPTPQPINAILMTATKRLALNILLFWSVTCLPLCANHQRVVLGFDAGQLCRERQVADGQRAAPGGQRLRQEGWQGEPAHRCPFRVHLDGAGARHPEVEADACRQPEKGICALVEDVPRPDLYLPVFYIQLVLLQVLVDRLLRHLGREGA